MSDVVSLAQELVRLGTTHIFGIPGEGPSLSLLEELERLQCRFHLVSHEAAGALMAGGFGRVSGIPGVSVSIKGPGLSNMAAGIATNWLDRHPALSLAESYGPGSSLHRMHKRMNHAATLAPMTKAYADNLSPSLLPKLWDASLAEEPGPVHLDISQQMSNTSLEAEGAHGSVDGSLSADIAGRIRSSDRPVVILGALAGRRAWRERLLSLKIPVFTTFAGKGAYDESLPHSAGVFTNSGARYAPERTLLPKSDLIIGLGLRTTELLDVKPLPAPLILADELPGRAAGLQSVSELVTGVAGIVEILELLGAKDWGATETAAAQNEVRARLYTGEWLPASACVMSQRLLPPDARFVLDTGTFATVGEHALTAHGPTQVIGSAQARSMGAGLPAAVGAAIAQPGKPVVAVIGDGGINMYPDSIRTAVREKLPLIVLLMTDGFFSSIRQVALQKGYSQQKLALEDACWPRIFEAWGCAAERVDSNSGLQRALSSWKVSDGPLLLQLAFDSDRYMTMTEGIR